MMKKLEKSLTVTIKWILILSAGFLIGWLVKPTAEPISSKMDHTDHVEADHSTIWTCSMHPQIRQPEPGSCPICGMELIPLDDQTSDENPREIKMSATAMALANVQTEVIGYGVPVKEIRLNGKVQPDERLIYSQVTHLDGRVEELNINFTGEPIQKGQRIAIIYSPDLVTAQEELFSAKKIKETQPGLFLAAKEKLKNWKLTSEQIDRILESGELQEQFPILADVSGIVMEKKVNLGDYISRGMPLYEIMDLSRVWILFDVYESDMTWVRIGSKVAFTVSSIPGESFEGHISFIDPVINPKTRVATARVEMSNRSGKLKPEMFASAVVKTSLNGRKQERLVVPKSAVMWTGPRSVVYEKIARENEVSFHMREIELGPLVGENYVVKSGLDAGIEIAVHGTFSIDAAAQLAGKPSMMSPKGGQTTTGHQHGTQPIGGTAVTTPAHQTSKETKAAIQELFNHYFPLKDALVKDDLTGATKEAELLKSNFESTNMKLFSGQSHDQWMTASKTVTDLLGKFISATDIEVARHLFKSISTQMVELAKSFGPFESTIFVQFCPMADNNTGADWLSLDEQILNPYFGDKMLRCGDIKATITSEK